MEVSCGAGNQRVKWLASVGTARYDEHSYQGWKQLGIPVDAKRIVDDDTVELSMEDVINHCLRDGDHIVVTTSLSGGN